MADKNMVHFTVTGIDSIFKRSAKFRAAAAKAPSAMAEYAESIGLLVKEVAEKNTPELSGKTKASFHSIVLGLGTHWDITLTNDSPIFPILIHGHKAFLEQVNMAGGLLVQGRGSDMLRMWANIPAQPPNPIMVKTMAEARPLIRIRLAEFKAKMMASVM